MNNTIASRNERMSINKEENQGIPLVSRRDFQEARKVEVSRLFCFTDLFPGLIVNFEFVTW
jgi:hypothetical protein